MKTNKSLLLAILLITLASFTKAQNVGINSDGSTPHSSAMLDVKSTSSGILIPRMTMAQKNAISLPATGLLIYQTNDTPGFYYYNGTAWTLIGTESGSESDPVFTAWDKTTGISISESQISDLGNYLTTETDPIYVAWDKDYNDLINNPVISNTQWTTTGSDIYYNTGNVGIGTTIPDYQFHVKSTTASAYGMIESSASHAGLLMKSSFGTESIFKSDATTGNVFLESPSGTPRFAVNHTNGNVGIGTTTPAYKLDVNGSINGSSVTINGTPVASSTDTYWSAAGSGKIYYSGGNVGVGTVTPAYPLDVTGDVNVTGTFRINGTALSGTGTVTSVDASGGTTGLTFSGGPVTTSGTLTMAGTLAVANGGTGSTIAAGARTNLGATTLGSSMFTLSNPSAITFPRFNADNSVSALTAANFRTAIGAGTGGGTVTSVTGTSPISVATGTTTPGISLGTVGVANGGTGQITYAVGDLLYASTTSVLSKLTDVATGNSLISGGVGVAPSWGKVGLTTHVSGTLVIANGGTGATTAAAARTGLGATTLGGNLFTLTNPSAITFPRFNADNTVSALSAADFRTAIGAGTGGGTVTSVTGTSPISVATGTTTPAISLGTVPVTNGGTGATTATVAGGVVYGSSTSAMASTAAGTAGQVLTSNGTSAPTWSSTASIGVSPVGSIMIWAGSTAPTGWLLCDGTAYTTAAYPALYAVIGTTYGTGIGFLVPNLKGKIPVGLNSADLAFDARGETGGEKTHTIATAELPIHNHTFTGTAHNHAVDPTSFNTASEGAHTHSYNDKYRQTTISDDASDRNVASTGLNDDARTTGSGGSHAHAIDVPSTTSTSTTATGTIGNTGSGTAMNVLQPYIVLYYIIKY